ncbi:hypothetical protein SAMN04515660_1359 [Luteibacter sp. 329MFSha]|nr:hypothetical protein SAMN04515660_1359 [Luteibacter sp. 329MFSha]
MVLVLMAEVIADQAESLGVLEVEAELMGLPSCPEVPGGGKDLGFPKPIGFRVFGLGQHPGLAVTPLGVETGGGMEGKPDAGEITGEVGIGRYVQWKILIPDWIEFSQVCG